MFFNISENTHYAVNAILFTIFQYKSVIQEKIHFLSFEEFYFICDTFLNSYLKNIEEIESVHSLHEFLSFKLSSYSFFDSIHYVPFEKISFIIIPHFYTSQFYLLFLGFFVCILFYNLFTSYATFYFLYKKGKVQTLLSFLYGIRMFILTKSKTFVYPVRLNTNVNMMTHIYAILFLNNIMGLIPYNNNLTSQFVNVWLLSLVIIIYLIVQIVKVQGFNYLKRYPKIDNYWYTSSYPFLMAIISHVFRIFSLSMRVFINMFAGHLLLGIFEHYIPLLLL